MLKQAGIAILTTMSFVCLTSGKLLAETANGNVATELKFGQTYARPAGVEHNIVNGNDGEFAFIEIELK